MDLQLLATSSASVDLWLAAADEALQSGCPLPPAPSELSAERQHELALALVTLRVLVAKPPQTPFPNRLGRFRLQRLIGEGRFSMVYRAFDPIRQREVAIKIARPGQTMPERFEREARCAALLEHSVFLPLLETFTSGPWACFVLPYFPGRNLADALASMNRPVSCAGAARLVGLLADGMQHAHERGVVHRDLKPANILVTRGALADAAPCQPRIIDFGLARICGDAPALEKTVVAGTLEYMAPEQALGHAEEAGPEADIYSLGVILYEVLTGRVPFLAEDLATLRRQIQENRPLPPGKLRLDLSRGLEALVLACLEKAAQNRPSSARVLAEALRAWQ